MKYFHLDEITMQILFSKHNQWLNFLLLPLPFALVFSMQSILTAAQSSHLSDWLSLISTVLDGVAGPA